MLLVLDAVVFVTGLALLWALGLAPRWSLLHAGLAYVTGWASLALAWTLAAIVGLGPGRWTSIGIAAAIAGAAATVALTFHRRSGPQPAGRRENRAARALAIVGAAALGILLAGGLARAATASADTEWDVWAFWLPKAKSIYYLGGIESGVDGVTSFASPEYPPLVPVVEAVAFHFAGVHPADLLLQRWLLAAAFFLAVGGVLRSVAPSHLVWPPLAMLAAAPAVVRYNDSLLADPIVAMMLGLAAALGVRWLARPIAADTILIALFVGVAALAKPEGLLLGYLLVAFLLLLGRHARPRWQLAAIAASPVVALVPWKLWLAANDAPTSSSLYDFSDLLRPAFLADRLDRLEYALREMTANVLSVGVWLLVVPLALAAALLAVNRAPRLATLTVGWITIGFLGLSSVYWISPLPVEFYVDTSAQRVLTSIVTVAAVLTPPLLGAALRSAEPEP